MTLEVKGSVLDPDPHQFADVTPKWMEYEPILALFQGFELFFEARIRIRVKYKNFIRIRPGSASM
jgi:hypothetical protein